MAVLKYYFLDYENLFDLAKFVVEENYNHHTLNKQKLQQEINNVYLEELTLNNSKIFVSLKEDFSIVGSIRVLNWNNIDILPIEKLFKVNIINLINSKNKEVWHIGRFAIKKGIDKKGFNIFKTLMTCAINEVCKRENSFALAECDAKLLRILNLLGMEAIVLGESIDYLSSETIPVMFTYEELKKFLDKNLNLLPENITSNRENVVLR